MRRKILAGGFAACAVICASTVASAYVAGPSNFDFLGEYPKPKCDEPPIPYDDSSFAWGMFRSNANAYIDCINDYVRAGNSDVERIREAQKKALRDAQEFRERVANR
jgi:hypothetical protein